MNFTKLPLLVFHVLFIIGCQPASGELPAQGTVSWGISSISSSNQGGVFILGVTPLEPADKAGFQPGDQILSVDGHALNGTEGLHQAIRRSRPYIPVSIVVDRLGARNTMSLLPRGSIRLSANSKASHQVSIIPPVPGAGPVGIPPLPGGTEGRDHINVLESAIIDKATGQIEFLGSYDPRYATGALPYLDILKTALTGAEPTLSLMPINKDRVMKTASSFESSEILPLLLTFPAAQIERQQLIQALAVAHGLTPLEYAALYDFAHSTVDLRGLGDPEEIFDKALRYVGWHQLADARRLSRQGTEEALWRAVALVKKGPQARELLSGRVASEGSLRDVLQAVVHIATLEIIGAPERLVRRLYSDVSRGERGSTDIAKEMFKFATTSMKRHDGRLLQNIALSKVSIGDAGTRALVGAHETLLVEIKTNNLDRESQLARIMYEADYVGKLFLLRPDLFPSIEGAVSYSEYISRKASTLHLIDLPTLVDAKFWFEPKRVLLTASPDGSTVSFDLSEMKFSTSMATVAGDALALRSVLDLHNDWVEHHTRHYEQYSRILPQLHSLREAAKVIALARLLKERRIYIRLDKIVQAKWLPPNTVHGMWRSGAIYSPGPAKLPTYYGVTGGVSFKAGAWTQYGPPSNVREARVSESLALSSDLSSKAVEAAGKGDLESARRLAELGAQALTGRISRATLARGGTAVPKVSSGNASPANVQLQRELAWATRKQVAALGEDNSNAQARLNLRELDRLQRGLRSRVPTLGDVAAVRALPVVKVVWGSAFAELRGRSVSEHQLRELVAITQRRQLANGVWLEDFLKGEAKDLLLQFLWDRLPLSTAITESLQNNVSMVQEARDLFSGMKGALMSKILVYQRVTTASARCLGSLQLQCDGQVLAELHSLPTEYAEVGRSFFFDKVIGDEAGQMGEWAREGAGINEAKQQFLDTVAKKLGFDE